ncbi:hypothetical protein [Halorhabdus salina]|uniref:hypothetical protein n=1 Tax=Halorhabdus salina TaxID=2750670 RepID=UPI0015EF531A|nr:hypothetical protein [Halorhabdus salina]
MSRRPAPDVAGVDTTGAGNAFDAWFGVALAEGIDPVGTATFLGRTGGLAYTDYEGAPAFQAEMRSNRSL